MKVGPRSVDLGSPSRRKRAFCPRPPRACILVIPGQAGGDVPSPSRKDSETHEAKSTTRGTPRSPLLVCVLSSDNSCCPHGLSQGSVRKTENALGISSRRTEHKGWFSEVLEGLNTWKRMSLR